MNWATTDTAWARITLFFMAAALVASGAAMWSGMHDSLAASGLMPHGVCYVWNPYLIGLHLVSDTLIGLAYFSIPITLVYFIRKRRDLPFNWMFLLFGLFIVACGTTHWMEVWTLWVPQYWLAGVVKAITAAASVPTAIALVLLIPQALAIPSAHQALEEADARKDRFLAILSHELRNPLNPIRTSVAILRQPGVDERQAQFARDVIDRQVAHMGRLLDDLLDISRIAQNRVTLVRERVDVAAAVNAALETTRPLIDAARQTLDVVLPDEPVPVDADPTRLAQILSNLLNNASKYTDAGGRITLSVAREGGEAVIRVRDTGIGIEPRHIAGLFELFSQVDSARNRGAGGLGIGLALVRNLVQMHDGSVTASSPGPGRGSEFIVRLPLAREVTIAGGRRAADDRMTTAKEPLRVLVVDDNVDSAETLAALLNMIGHDVRQANDATTALAVAAEFRPQVGIFDIGLPEIDGYELARRARREEWGKDMRLIALTGWGKDEDKQLAVEAGFDEHLTKPVDLRALEEELAKVATQG